MALQSSWVWASSRRNCHSCLFSTIILLPELPEISLSLPLNDLHPGLPDIILLGQPDIWHSLNIAKPPLVLLFLKRAHLGGYTEYLVQLPATVDTPSFILIDRAKNLPRTFLFPKKPKIISLFFVNTHLSLPYVTTDLLVL